VAAFESAHALVVGIADYQFIRRLPQVNDARDIIAVLQDPARCGYRPENVHVLLDADATGPAIRDGLKTLELKASNDATVFIYFSGHGGRITSGPRAGDFLLPVDTVFPSEEDMARTAIAGVEFTEALNKVKARKMVVVFDCCHSGGIGEPRDAIAGPALQPGLSEAYYEQLKGGRGRVILASSRSDEFSYVMAGAQYGLFTEHLLGGLRGGVASDDGVVRIFDLFEYLQPRVTKAQPKQHPIFKGELEENFPVALYRGGEKGVVSTVEGDFRYDAYISYVDKGVDAEFVWDVLVPKLEGAGLKIAVSGDSADPGVPRVVGIERGIRQAKRTLIILTESYLADAMADFENMLGQTMDIQEGTYRLLPVKITPLADDRLPVRLSMLESLDLANPRRADRNYERLIKALKGPLPTR
jgi:Caspase domain/TIR domain